MKDYIQTQAYYILNAFENCQLTRQEWRDLTDELIDLDREFIQHPPLGEPDLNIL